MARFSISSCALALSLMFGTVSTAQAGTIPYGPKNDVSNATVASWGWTQKYAGAYGQFDVNIASLFAGIKPTDFVMIGGRRVGSGVVDVLAAARLSDILMQTAQNVTHQANGAEWYSNGYSMGFAGLGDRISQFSADTNGMNERDRLSWHTSAFFGSGYRQDPSRPAVEIEGGWRSGTNAGLNNSTSWERVVWVQQATPEPHEWILIAMALGGLAFFYRRQQTVLG